MSAVSENGSATPGWVPVVAGHVTYEDVLCDLGSAPGLCPNFISERTVQWVKDVELSLSNDSSCHNLGKGPPIE